jgi:hypothetical protein
MYPGTSTIAGCEAARLPLEQGGFGHTTRSCHRADEVPAAVDLFERPASKAAVVVLLLRFGLAKAGWMDGLHISCASGSCGGRHGFLGDWEAARLLMGRARACGVDRRLARFL